MKQLKTNQSKKNQSNFVPKGVIVVDGGVGGATLLHKLRLLPLHVVYLNVANATTSLDANNFVIHQVKQLQCLNHYVMLLPSFTPNVAKLKQSVDVAQVVCAEPPLYQARQYSTMQVAVISATNRSYDGCQTINGSCLANLINGGAPEREIRAQIESDFANVICDTVAFDDCVFSTQRNNFWSVCPNVKFFDCADSLTSSFFKNKKLRQNNDLQTQTIMFCDNTGKTEQIFNKILQKIYKSY